MAGGGDADAAAQERWRRRSREGGWDRDEWDVTLADGTTCRVFRARDTGTWFMEAVVD
jgi:hypothetical protein